ncbi:MAG: hypothetical protein PHY80_04480 [Rickettsiales bacterium]|nr:hypothetical protein [Rickettsiales bacterium]
MIEEKLKTLEHIRTSEKKIKYFSRSDISEYEVILDENAILIYAKTKQCVNLSRIEEGDKQHMFLINEDSRFYIIEASKFEDEFEIFHSSSCFEKIKAAGEIDVRNGIIIMVSNISGHYLPHERTLLEFAHTISKLAHLSDSHEKLGKHKGCQLRGFLCNGESFIDETLTEEIRVKFKNVFSRIR